MKTFSFIGEQSGDGDSFCWKVSADTHRWIIGDEVYKDHLELLREMCPDLKDDVPVEGRVYPEHILNRIGCEDGKKYRFVISAEEVNE